MEQVERAHPGVSERKPAPLRLAIYVNRYCANCSYALEVAAYIRIHFPQVEVRVIDLETTAEPPPDAVFATPTYLLDGRVWSLGNPSRQQIEAAFGAATPSAIKEGRTNCEQRNRR